VGLGLVQQGVLVGGVEGGDFLVVGMREIGSPANQFDAAGDPAITFQGVVVKPRCVEGLRVLLAVPGPPPLPIGLPERSCAFWGACDNCFDAKGCLL
jgi:hypothetical protein